MSLKSVIYTYNSGSNLFIGNQYISGNIYVTGSIIPSGSRVYDLGSPTNNFKDVYLSSSTIYMDNNAIFGATDIVPVNVGDAVGALASICV